MITAGLLPELEPLTHDARMRRLVELGRASCTEPNVAAALDELERAAPRLDPGRLQALLTRRPATPTRGCAAWRWPPSWPAPRPRTAGARTACGGSPLTGQTGRRWWPRRRSSPCPRRKKRS